MIKSTNLFNTILLPISRPRYVFGNHSRRDTDNLTDPWSGLGFEPDSDDVSDVDNDKDIDSDSGDATADSDPDGINMPDLEITMKDSRNDDEDINEDNGVDQVKDDDNIQIDADGECEDEMEPQFKRKKTQ